MYSKFLAAGAVVAMMATAAVAQTSNSAQTSTQSSSSAGQTASAKNEWQASKLIGTNVYNAQNEKIGDIRELLLDRNGNIAEVAVSVGGFLGMGAHDVAVKFSELKWVDEPVRTSTSSNTGAMPSSTTGSNTRDSAKRNYPDHAVLDASKDQLKSLPQFDYSK